MKKILLDTSGYTALKQGHAEVLSILQHADWVCMSVIVLGELMAGFYVGSKAQHNLKELHEFLSVPTIKILPIDENTMTFYAHVYTQLRSKGKPIPTNDLWIAATALQHGCKVLSFDKHFALIDNVIVVKSLAEFLL